MKRNKETEQKKQAAGNYPDFEVRTDLAVEEQERFSGDGGEISGVSLRKWRESHSDIRMTEGKILDASYLYTSILLKPSREVKADQLIGQYIPTIDVTKLQQDKKVYRAVCNLQEDYRKRCNLNAGRKATAFMSK